MNKEVKFFQCKVGTRMVTLKACESSNIKGYGDDMGGKLLWILFNNDKLYAYRVDKAAELFRQLDKADSKGKWVNQNLVKEDLPYVKYPIRADQIILL